MSNSEISRTNSPTEFISQSSSSIDKITFSHCWEIKDFRTQQLLHSVGKSVASQKFGNLDYEFQLKIFPSGKEVENKDFMALFLIIGACPHEVVNFSVQYKILTANNGVHECQINRSLLSVQKGAILSASKLISLNTINNEADLYLPNDTFTFKVDIVVYEIAGTDDKTLKHERDSMNGDQLSTNETRSRLLDFTSYFESGEFADFTIKTPSRNFKVHKIVLSGQSEFFAAMFRMDGKESQDGEVDLDISADILESILKFLYSGVVPNPELVSFEAIYAADRLLVPSFINFCRPYFVENLSVETTMEYLKIADTLDDQWLFAKVVKFFLCHRSEIMKTPKWEEIRAQDPLLVAQLLEVAFYGSSNEGSSLRFTTKRRRCSK